MKYLKYCFVVVLMALFLTGCSLLPSKNGDSSTTPQKESDQKGLFSGSFKDVIAKNIPMKCESAIEGEDGEGTMAGIVQGNQYVGKMTVDGKVANVLMKDNCMWNWQEGATVGIKTCFEPTEEGGSMWAGANSGQMSENVNCMPTVIAPGIFSPPANIDFMDMDELSGDLTDEQIQKLERMSEESNQ